MIDLKRKVTILNNRINLRLHDMLLPDYAHIRHIRQHLQLISLGSRPGKFALDFTSFPGVGFNLAVMPQTLEYDFRMLKNYFSYLDEFGPKIVVLTLCPFSLLKTRYGESDGDLALDHRYYLLLHHAMINGYKEATYQLIKKHPLLYALNKPAALKAALSKRFHRMYNSCSTPGSKNAMVSSARHYITAWCNEFGISNLNAPLNKGLTDAIGFNCRVLDNIRDFCVQRELKPVVVIPPLSEELRAELPDSFMREALLEPLKKSRIDVLDFSSSALIDNERDFYDALCLNAAGRKKFTATLIDNLKQSKLI